MESKLNNKPAIVRSVLILGAIWLSTQFAGLFSPPLLDDVDAIHVEAAREMVQRHDYVTLYVDGIRYLDKPPLPYWLGAFGIHIFGLHDWAIRFSLAMATLSLIFYLYWMGSRWFSERAGFFTACIVATSIGPYIFTRFFIPDIILALWMTIAADLILVMVRNLSTSSSQALPSALFGAVCAGAVLTKGLIGVFFPIGLLILYLFVTGRLRYIMRFKLWIGAATFLTLGLPWHILAAIRNRASGTSRGWVWFYFINEQLNRYLNKRIPRDYDKVPLLAFWVLFFVWLLPWTFFAPGAVRRLWKRRQLDGPELLFASWALLVLGFFSFSTRQEYYGLPALPALGLICGAYLASESHADRGCATWLSGAFWFLFSFGAMGSLACLCLAFFSTKPQPDVELYRVLTAHPGAYSLSFGHLFDLTASAFGYFRVPLLCVAISLLVATGLALWFRLRAQTYASVLALSAGMCAVLGCVHTSLQLFYPILGSQPLAAAIQQHWQAGAAVVLDGEYSNGSSINFYLDQPVFMLNGRINNLWYGSLYADAPHRFETEGTFLSLWVSNRRIFFVTHSESRTLQWQVHHGGTVIAELAGKYVLVNH